MGRHGKDNGIEPAAFGAAPRGSGQRAQPIHRGGGQQLSYDTKGNLTGDSTWTYTFDADNKLKTANKSGYAASLAYDAEGRLRRTTLAGIITDLAYDGTDLVAEYNSAGTLLRRYVHGPGIDEPLVWYEGTGTTNKTWLYADHQGSIVGTANGAGTSSAIHSYGPYGEPNVTTGVRFRYTGQQLLGGLNPYYYKARFCSPALGRFLQTDPIGYADDNNLYAYVGNDPVNANDPSGLAGIVRGAKAWFVSQFGHMITHSHHMVPTEILKSLPAEVANNPAVRGVAGAPNKWPIPADIHWTIHNTTEIGGERYNEAFKAAVGKITEERPITAADVVSIRDQMAKTYGLEKYRPYGGGSSTLREVRSAIVGGVAVGLDVLDAIDPWTYMLGIKDAGGAGDMLPERNTGGATGSWGSLGATGSWCNN